MQNKKTVKKPVVKSKSKVVAGGKKARFSKPVLVLIVLSSLLVITAVGTFGYYKLKESDLQAKAARWKEVKPWKLVKGQDDGVKFVACREYTVIGPDAQQDKPIKVTMLASKPKSLTKPPKDAAWDKPIFFFAVYRPTTQSVEGWPEVTSYKLEADAGTGTWWNGELAIRTNDRLRTGDKLVPAVYSNIGDRGFQTGRGMAGSFGGDFNDKSNKFSVLYMKPPSAYGFTQFKDYQAALKTWQQKTPSVAQLPNCN